MDILSYFEKDEATYAEWGIVVFRFKDEHRSLYLTEWADFYRQAFISDEQLSEILNQLGRTREEIISDYVPSKPVVMSGDFGEIFSYLLFDSLYPDYNVKPLRWRWKEHKDRPVPCSDILWLLCADYQHPQSTDRLMSVEVKNRATVTKNVSSINDAVGGMLKDRTTRTAISLSYLKRQFSRDRNFDDARIVERFENAVDNPYQSRYNAIAIVDSAHLESHHVANLDQSLIKEVQSWNAQYAHQGKQMCVIVAPVTQLKELYEEMFNKVRHS